MAKILQMNAAREIDSRYQMTRSEREGLFEELTQLRKENRRLYERSTRWMEIAKEQAHKREVLTWALLGSSLVTALIVIERLSQMVGG